MPPAIEAAGDGGKRGLASARITSQRIGGQSRYTLEAQKKGATTMYIGIGGLILLIILLIILF
ncbi:MAG TPA: hypothetical protein VMK31_04395 [Sphingomicrobium sp.]|nr:hypothetical protein [Sphingomicrobium sp.]